MVPRIMTVAYLGPENIRVAVEHVLANANVDVPHLSAQATGVAIIILALPLRKTLLTRLKVLHPQALLITIARHSKLLPLDAVVVGFAEVWKIRQYVRAVFQQPRQD